MYSGASPVSFKSDTCLCVFTNLVNYFYHIINLFIVLFNPLYLVYFLAMGVGVLFSLVIFVRSVGRYEIFQPPRR